MDDIQDPHLTRTRRIDAKAFRDHPHVGSFVALQSVDINPCALAP
jgi:hypothetical protein